MTRTFLLALSKTAHILTFLREPGATIWLVPQTVAMREWAKEGLGVFEDLYSRALPVGIVTAPPAGLEAALAHVGFTGASDMSDGSVSDRARGIRGPGRGHDHRRARRPRRLHLPEPAAAARGGDVAGPDPARPQRGATRRRRRALDLPDRRRAAHGHARAGPLSARQLTPAPSRRDRVGHRPRPVPLAHPFHLFTDGGDL